MYPPRPQRVLSSGLAKEMVLNKARHFMLMGRSAVARAPRTPMIAAGALLLGWTATRAASSARGGPAPFYAAPAGGTSGGSYAQQAWARDGFHEYTLLRSRDAGADSKLLTFKLPEAMRTLGGAVISGVKVRKTIGGEALDKSYSPTSHCEAAGTFDLLVKAYAPRPGGGLGAYLCGLAPGDAAEMKIKPPKKLAAGEALGRGRYRRISMLAGGTGVAPFMNLAATLLADADDATLLDLVVSHREAPDALLRGELEALADASNGRLRVHHTFSRAGEARAPPAAARAAASGPFHSLGAGRIDVDLARAMLPDAAEHGVFVLVCGTDGFVGDMAGPIERVRDPVTNKKTKIQGPTLGVLGELGFAPDQVFKL